VVRIHAGEPPFVLNRLQISVYEFCTDGKLTSSFGLFSFCRAVIRNKPEHGIEVDFQVLRPETGEALFGICMHELEVGV
jgi:hypothetical protein